MAIEIQQEKRKNPLGWLIAIIILGIIGWFGWQFFKPAQLTRQPKMEEILPTASQLLMEAKLDTGGVLNHPIFLGLTSHINWPLPPPKLGKTNPFQPF